MEYVIVLDFGYTKDRTVKSTIHDLAGYVLAHYADRRDVMVLAQEETYVRLRLCDFPAARLTRLGAGQSSTNGTSGGGSYHVLDCAKATIIDQMMERNGKIPTFPFKATVVAHQLHVKRAIRQGKLFKLDLEAAKNLPTKLYAEAEQWWCRSEPAWKLRELVGYIPLKLAGQI